jgi:hypothetical protein
MKNPIDIQDEIVEVLRANSTLVELLGGDQYHIFGYTGAAGKDSILEAIFGLEVPRLMVAHQRSQIGERGEIQQWQHVYGLYIKCEDVEDHASIFEAIVNATIDDYDFFNYAFDQDCDPPFNPRYERMTTPEGQDFYVLSFTVGEKGG